MFDRNKWQKILAFGLLALLVVGWLSMSWLRWSDCLVDFGRELYIPWQIDQGKVLYRDLYFYYGPLVKYFHAFLFKCFGASFHVLIITNLILLLITVFAVYLIFRFYLGLWAGIVAVYLFLGIFAFGRYTETGNYNYICPYSNELVYGMTLSLLGLLLIRQWLKESKFIHCAGIGFLIGLIFLTKVEVFFAFLGAMILALLLDSLSQRLSMIIVFKRSIVVLFFALIAPMSFLLYLTHQASFLEALNFLLKPYIMVHDISHAHWAFYSKLSGFDDPRGNGLIMLTSTGRFVFMLLTLGGLSYLISLMKDKRIQDIILLIVTCVGYWVAVHVPTNSVALVFRGLPVILITVILVYFYQFFKMLSQGQRNPGLIFRAVVTVFALMLIFKILLYVTQLHYGFVLAMPGAIIMALVMTHDAACFGRGRFYSPRIFRVLSIIFLSCILIVYFRWSRGFYEHINYPVSQGKDRFYSLDNNVVEVGYKSVLVDSIVNWLDKNTGSKDTVVVMPEGVMINYLSRRQNPMPVFEFPPDLLSLLGEDRIIDSLIQTKPDYIIVIHRDMLEHGAQTFGIDYGQRIEQWISKNYENEFMWGELPSKVNNNIHVPQAYLLRRTN